MPGRAAQHAERAVELSRRASAAAPTDPKAHREVGLSLFALGFAAYHEGDLADVRGARCARRPRCSEVLHAESPDDLRLTVSLAGGHWSLAGTLWGRKRLAEAVEHYDRARALQEEVLRASPTDRPARRQLAYTHESLGALWSSQMDPRAVAALRRALDLRQDMARSDPRDADARLNAIAAAKNLAMALARFGDVREAMVLADKSVAEAEAELAAHPRDVRVRMLAAEAYGARSSVEQRTPRVPAPAVQRLRLEREREWLSRAVGLWRALEQEGVLSAPARRVMQDVTERAEENARELEQVASAQRE